MQSTILRLPLVLTRNVKDFQFCDGGETLWLFFLARCLLLEDCSKLHILQLIFMKTLLPTTLIMH